MEFNPFRYMSGDNRTSYLHGVPIQFRNEAMKAFKDEGFKIKIRYRGPRSHNVGRGWINNRSSCLMADATTFAVYGRR